MLVYFQLEHQEQTSDKFYHNTNIFIHEIASENIVCKMTANFSRGKCVDKMYMHMHIYIFISLYFCLLELSMSIYVFQ